MRAESCGLDCALCCLCVCVWGSVCECVSDSRPRLVDGAIQSRRHAPQKYRLVMSALFQGVCSGMPDALSFTSLFPARQSAIKPRSRIENYTHAANCFFPIKTGLGILNVASNQRCSSNIVKDCRPNVRRVTKYSEAKRRTHVH